MQNLASKLVYFLVFFAIFQLLILAVKWLGLDDLRFGSLAVTNVLQMVFLFVLAIVSLICTVTLVKKSREYDNV